jgi:hypothetical protein
VKEIKLTKGFVTVVDDEDFDFLSQWKWHARQKRNLYYAGRTQHVPGGRPVKIMMHRVIAGINERSVHVDHRNGNTLDNTRQNIRKGTHGQNLQNCAIRRHNKSGFIGVWWDEKLQKFTVKLQNRHIGCFPTAESAAKARDRAARKIFGEFGTYNFPREGERPARA